MQTEEPIKILIVDDMPPAREGLRLQLEMLNNIKLVGEAASADEALEKILSTKPNLVFLDLNLPQKSGFDLLDELKKYPEINIEVVFVTGHPEHALKSFEYFPFHFLLKPVASQKLKEVINRFAEEKFEKSFLQRLDELLKNGKINFKSENGYLWLQYKEILWFRADRNYTEIFMENGEKELVSDNLGNIMKNLPQEDFFRCHRSYIINLRKIRKVNQRNGVLTLKNSPFKENPLVSKENFVELIRLLGIN